MAVEIPDFTKMADDELHGWEFVVYQQVPEDQGENLIDIIGEACTKRYYEERGRRLDLELLQRINADIAKLVKYREETSQRLKDNKSGNYHFAHGIE